MGLDISWRLHARLLRFAFSFSAEPTRPWLILQAHVANFHLLPVEQISRRSGTDSTVTPRQASFEFWSTSRSNPNPLEASPRPVCFCARNQTNTSPEFQRVRE